MLHGFSEIRLVNGSTGDPALYLDTPGRNNAFLFDAGENGALDPRRLADLEAVFLTHHHIDHFVGFDRIVRANLDGDKTLQVFGPAGTIRRVYDRIRSYQHAFFPFQKLVIRVREILEGRTLVADLECAKRFPEPEVTESRRRGPVIYENAEYQVEAALVDHTVPCLSFALVGKKGYHPDSEKLARARFRPGPWVAEVLRMLQENATAAREVEIQGGRYSLGALAESYFTRTERMRIAYVVDTCWSEEVRPQLLKLAHKANRLYCDCFYANAHSRQAATYKHMTARQAAEFALTAKVEELVLIHFSPRYAGKYGELLSEARERFPAARAEIPPAPE